MRCQKDDCPEVFTRLTTHEIAELQKCELKLNKVIAIGGSSGALRGLREILARLPANFGIPILVVVHLAPEGPPISNNLLKTHLEVVTAEDGMIAKPGLVYIAPPDRHLVVEAPSHIRILKGPRENRSRPAIDPLLRSVGRVYRGQALGVVLSGALDDGAAGLAFLRKAGGEAIVQDPAEAIASDMPRAALRAVPAARRLSLDSIATAMVEFGSRQIVAEAPLEAIKITDLYGGFNPWVLEAEPGIPSPFTCPECSGCLFDLAADAPPRYRCRTGHAYSVESLHCDQTENLERLLWAAARALEERADLNRRTASHFEACGDGRMAARSVSSAEQDMKDAEKLRGLLFREVS